MKSFFPLFLACTAFCSCSSSFDEEGIICIQIKDASGRSETFNTKERIEKFAQIDFFHPQPYTQVTRIFNKEQNDHSRSIITSYHPNGNIKQYLEGIDSVAKGSYQEWHANGAKKIDATVVGGPFNLHYSAQKDWLFDGTSKVWDEENHLLAEIQYDLGMLEGVSTYYYKQGEIKTKIPYKKNQIDGLFLSYYPSGALKTQESYKKGIKQGTSIGYWENEQPTFLEEYEEGLLQTAVYHDINGDVLGEIANGCGEKILWKADFLEKKISYLAGKPEGKVILYASSGDVSGQYEQKDGQKQGKETLFYPRKTLEEKLQPKLQVEWDRDMIHGLVKTWYPCGTLESQKEYAQNKKNGMCCAWYKNGSLMLLEKYENDLLSSGSYYQKDDPSPTSKVSKGSGIAVIYDGKSGQFLRKIAYENGKPQE